MNGLWLGPSRWTHHYPAETPADSNSHMHMNTQIHAHNGQHAHGQAGAHTHYPQRRVCTAARWNMAKKRPITLQTDDLGCGRLDNVSCPDLKPCCCRLLTTGSLLSSPRFLVLCTLKGRLTTTPFKCCGKDNAAMFCCEMKWESWKGKRDYYKIMVKPI